MKRVINTIFVLLSSIAFLHAETARTERPVTLDEFLHEVETGNLALAAERFNVGIAEAEAVAARVFPDPGFTFEAGEDYYSLDLGYTLELGGKRKARIRLAESLVKAENYALAAFFEELRAEAAAAYLECATRKSILEFRRNSYRQMLEIARADSIRFRLGEITELDARQSAVEAMSMLTEVYEQENEYLTSLIELNGFTGRNSGRTLLPVGETLPPDIDRSLDQLIGTALENRPELLLFEQLTDAAYREWKLAKAERKMDIDLFVGYERDWKGYLPNHETIRGGLTIPLGFSRFNKGDLHAASRAIDQREAEYRAARFEVENEVVQAYSEYRSLTKQVNQFRSGILTESEKLLEGAVYKYQRGESDLIEVLIARRTYNDIQEQFLEKSGELARARIHLERVCGTWNL